MRECLETLTDLQLESVRLAYFNGYTYSEVATLLEKPLPDHQDPNAGRSDPSPRLPGGSAMSTDLHTLSGAYALDALSAEEAEEFRTHLDGCQACREEVRELQARRGPDGGQRGGPPRRPPSRPACWRPPTGRRSCRPRSPPVQRRPRSARRWTPGCWPRPPRWSLVGRAVFGIAARRERRATPTLASGVVAGLRGRGRAHRRRWRPPTAASSSVATSPEPGEMAVDTDELPAARRRARLPALGRSHGGAIDARSGILEDPRRARPWRCRAEGPRWRSPSSRPAARSSPPTDPIVQVDPRGGLTASPRARAAAVAGPAPPARPARRCARRCR